MEDYNLYENKITFKDYRKILFSTVIKVLLFFFLVMILAAIIYLLDIFGLRDQLTGVFQSFTKGLVEQIGVENGRINTQALIINNIRVSALAFLVGIIPFLYLPIGILFVNSLIVGLLLGNIASESILASLGVFFLGILPHGILELPAIFLSVASGLLLCKAVSQKLMKKSGRLTIKEAFINGIKTYLYFCIPLLIVAGFIETIITPLLLGL